MTNVNLNLLKTLDVLLTERNVSRAAIKLHLTQSAVSLALKQLREHYNDALLVRRARDHMQLTQLGAKLVVPTRQAIEKIEAILSIQVPFDPTISEKTFHVAVSSEAASTILPRLIHRVMRSAPHVSLVQHDISGLDNTSLLNRMDVIIGQFSHDINALKSCRLYQDKLVVVGNQKHAFFTKNESTAKQWQYYSHISNYLYSANTRFVTHDLLLTLQLLKNSHLLALLPEKSVQPFLTTFALTQSDPPFKSKKIVTNLYWHRQNQTDATNKWLREMIQYITKKELY